MNINLTVDEILIRLEKNICIIAADWARPNVPLEDLQQVGRIAVVEALACHRCTTWSQLQAYLQTMVRRSVSKYVRQNRSVLRESETLIIARRYVRQRKRELELALEYEVTPREVYASFVAHPPVIQFGRLRLGEPLSPKYWTLGMIEEVVVSEGRSEVLSSSDIEEGFDALMEDFSFDAVDRVTLQQALSVLSPNEEPILMLWAAGYLPEEISRVLNMKSKTVSTLTWRARKKLENWAKSQGLWCGGVGKRLVNRGMGNRNDT